MKFISVWSALLSLALLSGCPAKTSECDPNTVFLALACGDQRFDGGNLELTRTSDKKTFAKSVSFSCPGPDFVFRLNVADYQPGDEFSLLFAPDGEDAAPTAAQTKAPDGSACLSWTVKLTGEANTRLDSGVSDPVDAKPAVDAVAPVDAEDIVAEPGSVVVGEPCSEDKQCGSGFCANRVCCAARCDGTCMACAASLTGGNNGDCLAMSKDKPDGKCVIATEKCGNTGLCDGAGACSVAATSVTCEDAKCDNGRAVPERRCSGTGMCQTVTGTPCGEYTCAAGACKESCQNDNDCSPTVKCLDNKCGGKRGAGGACTSDSQCSAGLMCSRDGVCCGSKCYGLCESCLVKDNAVANGQCLPVKSGDDPQNQCSDEIGANSCGQTGQCNGARGCAKVGAGVNCAAEACSGSSYTAAAACDGSGACAVSTASTCPGNLKCGAAGKCRMSCGSDNDCASGYCDVGTGKCTATKPIGRSCAVAADCTSGFCADAVCCNAACNGACLSCSAQGQCGSAPFGATDNLCPAPKCQGNSYVAAATCNGSGGCGNPVETPCGAYKCQTSGCPTTCSSDSTCSAGYFCRVGRCKFETPNLIVNPSAEDGLTSWSVQGSPVLASYGVGGYPAATDQGPPNRGTKLFAGRPAADALKQEIDVTAYGSQISLGRLSARFSAYLGGIGTKPNGAQMRIFFYSATGLLNVPYIIGPTASERGNLSGLVLKTNTVAVPSATVRIEVDVSFWGPEVTPDGVADALELVLLEQ